MIPLNLKPSAVQIAFPSNLRNSVVSAHIDVPFASSAIAKSRSRSKKYQKLCAASDPSQAQPEDTPASTSSPPIERDQGSPSNAASPASSSESQLPVAILRKVTAAADANEALDILATEIGEDQLLLTDTICQEIMAGAIERGNVSLALSIFRAMTSVGAVASAALPGGGSALGSPALASGSYSSTSTWPPATTETAAALVLDLCRALCTREAVDVVQSVRSRGLPTSQDVQFGYVVECPADVSKPLAVVQPQEGVKSVADAYSRYEYELYSGTVMSCTSDSLATSVNALVATAVRFGIIKKPSCAAVHTFIVETPSGQQRTFRFGTATSDVPAKVGDRITVIGAPQKATLLQLRVVSAAPPNTKPGESLLVSNHTTKTATQVLRPPNPDTDGLPRWVIPLAITIAASDAASTLINPTLPYLIAGGVAATAATAYAGTTLVIPRMKQLPERIVEVQYTRQRLLGQHTSLDKRIVELVDETVEDVRTLARLWQLQNKMGVVSAGEAYATRLQRVAAAKSAIELRLAKRLELLDAYARVINMIEIEVEMETEVQLAEIQGIEQQIVRLGEIEELQAEWQLQAEAQDEVERLLRTSS